MTSRRFSTRAVTIAGTAALLLFSIAFVGCSHRYSTEESPAPGVASDLLGVRPGDLGADFSRSRSLFPLAVGNHWEYRVRSRYQILDPAAPPPEVFETPYNIDIEATATLDGRDYFLQSEGDPRLGGVGLAFPVRSSRFGLYELELNQAQQSSAAAPVEPAAADLTAYVDGAIADPAKRAAYQRAAAELAAKVLGMSPTLGIQPLRPNPGAAPNELTLLSYPLFVGARWIVRKDPQFGRIVVAHERVLVPLGTFPAWKVRGTSELYGPNDRVNFWYSNLGLLALRYHAETNATDSTGAIIGRVAIDSDQSLTAIHLVRAGTALATEDNAAE